MLVKHVVHAGSVYVLLRIAASISVGTARNTSRITYLGGGVFATFQNHMTSNNPHFETLSALKVGSFIGNGDTWPAWCRSSRHIATLFRGSRASMTRAEKSIAQITPNTISKDTQFVSGALWSLRRSIAIVRVRPKYRGLEAWTAPG